MCLDRVTQRVAVRPLQRYAQFRQHLVRGYDVEGGIVNSHFGLAAGDAGRGLLQIQRIGQVCDDFVIVHGDFQAFDVHQRMHAFVENRGLAHCALGDIGVTQSDLADQFLLARTPPARYERGIGSAQLRARAGNLDRDVLLLDSRRYRRHLLLVDRDDVDLEIDAADWRIFENFDDTRFYAHGGAPLGVIETPSTIEHTSSGKETQPRRTGLAGHRRSPKRGAPKVCTQ